VYGTVTCFSHWLFIKGEIIDSKDIRFTVHKDILPLHASGTAPCASSFLHALNVLILKPKKLVSYFASTSNDMSLIILAT
jgi:hypothetical protein